MIGQILMFTGVGGIGKTSVARALTEYNERAKLGLNMLFMPSTTRETYKRLGLSMETDPSTMSREQIIEVQLAIIDDFVNAASRLFKVNSEVGKIDLFVMDRSPFDYVSYLKTVVPDLLPEMHALRQHKARKLMLEAQMYTANLKPPALWYFPYPVPWSVEDGFRSNTEKNQVWDNNLRMELCVLAPHGISTVDYEFKIPDGIQTTPEMRADDILHQLGFVG